MKLHRKDAINPRTRVPTRLRNRIRGLQDDRCFVCPFPLDLGCDLHHLIPLDVGGTDHALNLVGLCPSHHAAVEFVRRHVAPQGRHGAPAWMRRARAALAFIDSADAEARRMLHVLAKPYDERLRDVIEKGIDGKKLGQLDDTSPYREPLARDIARIDAQLLVPVNAARPRAILQVRIEQKELEPPSDDASLQSALERIRRSVTPHDVQAAIRDHLNNIWLPFDITWLTDAPLSAEKSR